MKTLKFKTGKKALAVTSACAIAAAATLAVQGLAYDKVVTVTLNGTALEFSQAPIIENGTTLVPMRTIFETLGMDVSWNGGNGTVTAVKNGKSTIVTIGSKTALINGETVELLEAPRLENGTTLVPLRVISEAMGVDVQWDQDNYTVIMTDEDKPKDDSWKENTGTADVTTMTVSGKGISAQGKTILITEGGDFTITGTNSDAMIRVNTKARVKLRLKGVNLTNTDGPAIFFEDCDKGYITISKGTENYLADGAEYTIDAKGTIFSNDDLEIQGGGSLTVVSNYNHAIASDDDIKIEEGTMILTAVGDGIHANDGIDISGGDITITATGDGIQSEDYVDITGGNINITTNGEVAPSTGGFGGWGMGGDMGNGSKGNRGGRNQQLQEGQQPDQNMTRPERDQMQEGRQPQGMQPPQGEPGGDQPGQPPQVGFDGQQPGQPPMDRGDFGGFRGGFDQPMGGNETASEDEYSSTKGIKAETNLLIRGGEITVNSADHALHSAGLIYISDGLMNLTSQHGKGMSAHAGLSIDGGTINVLKSTEGIESKDLFCINGGTIHVTASDDGLNAGGTNGRDAGTNGHAMYLNGGYVYVNAAGDGLDANGVMYINGGTIIVNGPTSNGNGALDSGGSIVAKGGTLIASGSSGMVEYPRGNDSTQRTVSYTLSQTQAADALLRIEDADGNEILTYRASKSYQNIVFSSPLLKEGKEYRILLGGSYEGGTDMDGLLTGGSYSGGTLTETFTMQGTTVTLGSQQRGMGGRGGFGGMW